MFFLIQKFWKPLEVFQKSFFFFDKSHFSYKQLAEVLFVFKKERCRIILYIFIKRLFEMGNLSNKIYKGKGFFKKTKVEK